MVGALYTGCTWLAMYIHVRAPDKLVGAVTQRLCVSAGGRGGAQLVQDSASSSPVAYGSSRSVAVSPLGNVHR